MVKKVIFILFLLITLNLMAQETRYSAKQLKNELDLLILSIEEVHPDPYTFVTKNSLIKEIDLLKTAMSDSMSLTAYFTLISPVISRLNDGHTGVKFPYSEWRKLNPYCFPFNPVINTNRTLSSGKKQQYLPENAVIKGINGIPGETIIQTLTCSISGEEEAFRISILKKSFVERFGAFFGYKEKYNIVFQKGPISDTITIQGLRLTDMLKAKRKNQTKVNKHANSTKPLYSFKLLDNEQTLLLTFKEFSDLTGFKSFLDSTFTLIRDKDINNLIIDVRGNGGGNSELGDELFQYISPVPFKQFGKVTTKYSDKRKAFYDAYRKKGFLKHLSDSKYAKLFLHEAGSIVVENDTILIALRKNPLRFKGNVYLLTNIESFSSATDFAWCFKKFKMGTIIGEKTGGHIVCFGDLIYMQLPVSKLTLYISHKEFYGYGATDKERHSVLPDHEVKSDNALTYTMDLIRNHRPKE